MGSGKNGWTFFGLNKFTKNKQKQNKSEQMCSQKYNLQVC